MHGSTKHASMPRPAYICLHDFTEALDSFHLFTHDIALSCNLLNPVHHPHEPQAVD